MALTSIIEAAIDANAPIHDDGDNGHIDTDEEKDAVMAGIARSRPKPLVTHPLIPTRRKYRLVRMKEMLSQVLGGTRGGLFSTGDLGPPGAGRSQFQPDSAIFQSPVLTSAVEGSMTHAESSRKTSISQQAAQNRAAQNAAAKKAAAASGTL